MKTMSKDNSDSFKLSRRKALAAMGSIGAAGALGIGGTYAQFSDTEETAVTFTAGGVDGRITSNGSYNGEHIDVDTAQVVTSGASNYGEVAVDVHFTDIKPGDFGCFNWGIEITNNPAWAAACIDVTQDIDYLNFEPEAEAGVDDEVSEPNIVRNADGSAALEASASSVNTDGELGETLLTLPYYDSDGTCQFFDPGTDPFTPPTSYTVPSSWWSNSQDGSYSTQVADANYLGPMTFDEAASAPGSLGTYQYNNDTGTLTSYSAPSGVSVGDGCIMLDGSIADSETGDNTQSYSALQPGSPINFGWDWHYPFDAGNEGQGDQMTVSFGFKFVQTRHTSAPQFGSFSPGSNTEQSP